MFDKLFSFLDSTVITNTGSMVGKFGDVITPLIGSCVILYALWLAWQSLYDAENMMIMESMKFIGSLALCTTIAFSTSWYLEGIVPMVYYSGDEIARVLLGDSGVGTIQTMFDNTVSIIQKLWDSVSFGIVGGDSLSEVLLIILFCILIMLGALPFIAVATAYLISAKVMVGLLLIIGPLYIMFAFFPSTRSMFQAWTGQCLNYLLLSILYPIAFNLFESTINVVTDGDHINIGAAFMTLVLYFVFLVLSTQIPAFCSSLTGGVGINGLVGNMGAGARTMGAAGKYSGANAAGRWAGNKARTGAKNLLDKAKNNIKPG
ncbi:conjugal transfer protein TrbL [Vibrio diabolicus]|uniref:Integral inner membrane protein of type IV secretion complex (VirB6) n=1 Tax=Vibrio sp. FF_273 TaxID=1652830 RepID=A0A0H4A4S8_9VIBR|nr:type IV secretion system protein [Vibrio diabolicus]AKN40891.1 Integral inner membrane protein of type IV secretion complex (VirB6) [Vibrio sp. FF_273]OCH65473.1 conjugal transfer protein TrbL [Vibrio diabolicus]